MRQTKVTTTVRLNLTTMEILKKYCSVLHKSQSELVEDAVLEYFANHELAGRYQLNVAKGMVILFEVDETGIPRVIEAVPLNGVPAEELVKQYSVKLQEPVQLIVQEGDKL